jgi:hypothetical protein
MLRELLSERRLTILRRWFDLVLQSYPADTRDFLRDKKDQFDNPVGRTIYRGLEGIYDGLLSGTGNEEISQFLDNVIRVRAVQDFSASQAVAFVFSLKKVVREEVGLGEAEAGASARELSEFDTRIDALALRAFDIFMGCRERLYEIRAMEIRNRTMNLLRRAGLVSEIPGAEEDLGGAA